MLFFPKNKTPPSFIKGGGWNFSKMAVIGAMGNAGKPGMGGGGGGKFFKSLYIVAKRVLTLLFYEDPLYCLSVPPPLCLPPPNFLSSSTNSPTALSVVLFLWLNGWWCHIWCAILLNANMDLYMWSLGTSVPEGPWCVFQAIRPLVYCGMKHNVVFYWCTQTCNLIRIQ